MLLHLLVLTGKLAKMIKNKFFFLIHVAIACMVSVGFVGIFHRKLKR